MDLDFEVLDAAITFATEHPAEFDMDFWFRRSLCGTTACLAGTIAVQAGYSPAWFGYRPVLRGGTTFEAATHVQLPDGSKDAVWNVAARLLGLVPGEDGHRLHELFTIAADVAEVIKVRNRWARQAGVAQRTWDVPVAVTS